MKPIQQRAFAKGKIIEQLLKDGMYSVTDDGRIINHDFYKKGGDRECRLRMTSCGYLETHLRGVGKIPVHRVIAIAFLGNPDEYRQVNHLNGIKTDNRPQNLEWATSKENINHAINTGLKPKTNGEQRRLAKLTREQVLEIKEKLRVGMSHTAIAKDYPVGHQAISKISNGSRWGYV